MSLTRKVVLVFLLAFFNYFSFQNAEAAKILCFYPNTGKSHLFVAKALMTELAQRGHYVTVVSGFPLSKPVQNYRDIYVPLDDLTERKYQTKQGAKLRHFHMQMSNFDKLPYPLICYI